MYLEVKRREFLALRQRQLTLFEYEWEFMRPSVYALEIMPTEVDKCRRFKDGLNDNIRLIVTSHHFTDFSLLVASALDVERVRDDEQSRRDKQHKTGPGQGQFSASATDSKKPKG